jgi:hypothetical protein
LLFPHLSYRLGSHSSAGRMLARDDDCQYRWSIAPIASEYASSQSHRYEPALPISTHRMATLVAVKEGLSASGPARSGPCRGIGERETGGLVEPSAGSGTVRISAGEGHPEMPPTAIERSVTAIIEREVVPRRPRAGTRGRKGGWHLPIRHGGGKHGAGPAPLGASATVQQ